MKKSLQKFFIASVAVGGLVFNPIIFSENNFQVVSVAHAEIQNVTASDSVICDFGEDDEKISNTVKNLAKMRATQAAKEKAGVFVKSYSKTVNGIVTDDDISVYASNNIEIIDVTYKKIPIQAHDVKGNDIGKIGFAYEATVTAKIDTSGLSEYVKHDLQEKYKFAEQNRGMQKNISKINDEFNNLRTTAENKNSEQIETEIENINNKVLSQEKFEEALQSFIKSDSKNSMDLLNQAIELYPDNALAYAARGELYYYQKNYEQAVSDSMKAIEIDDSLAYAYNVCGIAYMDLKNYHSAVFDFNKSIRLDSNDFTAYSNRSHAHCNLKNYWKL